MSARTTCPVCAEPAQTPFTPFCCRRCADVDLGRWLTGQYRIPASGAEDGDESDSGTA